jgi:threonine/homoserine/homoserine lactone efflux protein
MTFVTGLGIGLVVAAQVGPVTLLIVRTIWRGGRAIAVGMAMATAVALIDLLYAVLGLAGVGRLMDGGGLRLAFGLASAAILLTIGAKTTWTGLRARIGLEFTADVVDPKRAFLTAVAATALNPLTIALWTVSFPAAAPHSARASLGAALLLLAGVGLGSLAWYSSFSTAVALARRRVGERLIRIIDVVSGVGLIGFGAYLGARAIHEQA